MGYKHISIRKAVDEVFKRQIFLPEIQRSLVWKNEQIETLFDSLFLGYPIGTMLWWKLEKSRINEGDEEIGLCQFLIEYSEFNQPNNPSVSIPLVGSESHYYVVLDGQQRLSALVISLLGSISRRAKRHRKSDSRSYPKKELFFNLNIPSDSRARASSQKRFRFFTEEEITDSSEEWFEVKEILKYETQNEIEAYLDGADYENGQKENLHRLWQAINAEDGLHYYEIDGGSYDDATELFLRLNSRGTPLSQIDLIFSALVKAWPGCRHKIEKVIEGINEPDRRFSIDKNLILRACLMFTGLPIDMKSGSFSAGNAQIIADKWPHITTAIEKTFTLLKNWGFSDESIMSYNAALPLAYYLYRGGQSKSEDEKEMHLFFVNAQLKNLFGSSTNSTLASIRANAFPKNVNMKHLRFKLNLFDKVVFPGGNDIYMREDNLKRCFEYDKGAYTFMLLSLLYKEAELHAITFHQDHLHPYSGFKKTALENLGIAENEITRWITLRNKLPNLQLLEDTENESKKAKPLKKWVDLGHSFKFRPQGISLELKDFQFFYDERKKLLEDKLRLIFNLPKEMTNNE